MFRVLVILSLVAAPLFASLGVAGVGCGEPRDAASAVVAAPSCCCCAADREHSSEATSIAASGCGCDMSPGAPAQPVPAPPPAAPDSTRVVLALPALAGHVAIVPDEPDSRRDLTADDQPPPHSHNETRALLCIWRT